MFQLSDDRIWMIPRVWSEKEPSKILQYGLQWNGFPSKFKDKIWVGFGVIQVISFKFTRFERHESTLFFPT